MGGPSSETRRRLGWWPARNKAPGSIMICMILLCLANQMAHLAANVQPPTSRYELKFQNELDNSTVIKQLAQQQVFKCQVRLAPLSQAAASANANSNNNQARRLKTASSWLTNEAAEQKYSKLVQELHNDPLSRMLLSPSSTEASSLQQQQQQQQQQQHKQLINVTYFSIDWLKDGQPVWSAFEGEPVAIVNVTLKTQRNLDKMARPTKSRVEIKNTLNGQQMKLTSRLRLGQLRWADSGQYKCVARVSFLQRTSEQQQQQQQQQQQSDGHTDSLIEYIEQSLESVGAHLIVMPLGSNSTNGINDGAAANNMNSHRPTGPLRTNNKETTATTNPQQPTTTGYDNEVRHRKAETGRPQLQLDDTQDTDEPSLTPSERSQFANGLAGPTATTGSQPNPLFEDDEDLFRLDFSELINGHHNPHQQQQQQQHQHQLATNDNISLQDQRVASYSGDTIDSNANDLLVNSQPIPRERQHEADLDWILDNGNDPAASQQSSGPAGDSGGLDDRGSLSSSPSSSSSSQYQQSANRFGDKKIDDQGSSRVTKAEPAESAIGGSHPSREPTPSWDDSRHELGGKAATGALPFDHRHDHHASSSSSSSSPPSLSVGRLRPLAGNPPPTADPVAATRSKLAKFVHKIVPEPSCYTGFGEHYRGNASISSDQRPCLNWLQVRAALSRTTNKPTASGESQSRTTLRLTPSVWHAFEGAPSHPDDHNHCRNPNNDQRGPWCFVAYSEELDGALVVRPYLSASRQQWKTVTSKRRTVRVGPDSGQLFVVAQCQLASCSEYLWLYVVAPPLGLLVLLTCLISFMIRSIRKSHYNAIFSAAYQRHSDPLAKSSNGLFSRLMLTKKRLVIDQAESVSSKRQTLGCCGLGFSKRGLPFTSSSLSSPRKRKPAGRGKYLDEDIFEVVDDIDWSDGQPTTTTSQSMSPSESFRLHSTATTCDEQHSIKTPVSPGCRQLHNNNNDNNNWHQHRSTLTHSKSINPVFGGGQVAALDLPLFHQSRQQSAAAIAPTSNNIAHKMSKSRSQVGPMFATLRCHVRNAQQQHQQQRQLHEANSCQQGLVDSSKQQETTCDRASPSMTSNQSSLQAKTITTTTTTINDRSIATNVKYSSDGSNGVTEAYTLASELTQLDASSVTLAYDTQPIYEGKFSQVQMAYIKQRKDDLAQATGRIGAQVAVCSLKEQAALDESVFYATNLRLRNLNHLNILKLMGYVQLDNNLEMGDKLSNETNSTILADVRCSLVYDMAHLIDLNDWLKEQCKDNNDLSLKQNLTCLAKQIALALDYLHDKDIIYKDLACRNCFLDVTRMLVKLASFNIEPEFEIGEKCRSGGNDEDFSKRMSLKSMVRPKYLLDYYVIDSRPAECQLLPLSWISLESILFNKFNKHTDIWSYGCLLYELFSLGEVAYFGYSSKQVIDSVRSNLMPPQPLLCPNGIYRLMCKCLSDIPTLRPDIKHVYEQLNLYSGQCSSFLNHHLCII